MKELACKNCKFFHGLKNFKDDEWEFSTVCTLFPQTEKGFDAYALVVSETEMCEAFSEVE